MGHCKWVTLLLRELLPYTPFMYFPYYALAVCMVEPKLTKLYTCEREPPGPPFPNAPMLRCPCSSTLQAVWVMELNSWLETCTTCHQEGSRCLLLEAASMYFWLSVKRMIDRWHLAQFDNGWVIHTFTLSNLCMGTGLGINGLKTWTIPRIRFRWPR